MELIETTNKGEYIVQVELDSVENPPCAKRLKFGERIPFTAPLKISSEPRVIAINKSNNMSGRETRQTNNRPKQMVVVLRKITGDPLKMGNLFLLDKYLAASFNVHPPSVNLGHKHPS